MLRLPIDKPGSVTHEYRGETLRIAFRYPSDSDIPNGVIIAPEHQPPQSGLGRKELVIYDLFEGKWTSYWGAVDAGIARAEAFVDANWVED